MPKFRKKPLVIEAVQWFPGLFYVGVYIDLDEGQAFRKSYVITAHHQRVYLDPGDWILSEPDGKSFYPCKPDIFAATYELAS